MKHSGLNQLVCAALINDRFCQTLLSNPAQALAMGYQDQSFSLTPEERTFVLGVRARQLEDFAAQIYCWMSGNGQSKAQSEHRFNGWRERVSKGNGANGNGHHERKRLPLGLTEPLASPAPIPAAA